MRLRSKGMLARVVTVSLRDTQLSFYSQQCRIISPTDSTLLLYRQAKGLFKEMWRKEPLRHLGVHFSNLVENKFFQTSFFDDTVVFRQQAIDKTIDEIRGSYGNDAVVRGLFPHSGIPPLCGGVYEAFPTMRSLL